MDAPLRSSPRSNGAAMLQRLLLLLILLTTVASAMSVDPGRVQAQQPLSDLAIEVDSARKQWTFTATNRGSEAVGGVVVDIEFIGSMHEVDNTVFDQLPEDGVWRIGRLAAGESATLRLSSNFRRDRNYQHLTLPARATIRSTVPGWRDALPHNNEAEAWAHFDLRFRYGAEAHMRAEARGLDNAPLRLGETVNIVFHVWNTGGGHFDSFGQTQRNILYGVRVRFEPTAGLRLAAPNPESGTSVSQEGNALLWDVGTLDIEGNRPSPTARIMTLAATPTSSAVEKCVVVEATSDAPAGHFVSQFCLGDQPRLFRDGFLDIFTMYPCVNTAVHPCHAEDTVEVAGVQRVFNEAGTSSMNLKTYRSTPDNPTVVIQVSDPQGRVIDSYSASVTSGGAHSWQTARDHHHNPIKVGGVQIAYSHAPFDDQLADWDNVVRTVSVQDLNGNPAPGRVKIRFPRSGNAYYDPDPTHTRVPYALSRRGISVLYFAEFSTLGTYVVDFTAAALHNGGTSTSTDDVTYTGTGRTIFHVGPIAELEANAAWLGSGAFTVTARNNGPDDAPAARVRVSLPQGMRFLRAEASEGSYDPNSGVWDIGGLALPVGRRAYSLPEDATLTVYTEPTGEAVTQPVTVSIANHQDYCVRIKTGDSDILNDQECGGSLPSGYTEHSTNYYDYMPGNNRVSLAARSTAAAPPPGGTTIRVTGMSVTSSPDTAKGYYLPGQDLEVEATFSDAVTAGPGAKILLQVGQFLREAAAVPSTGEAIRFRYRVQSADRTDPGKPIRVPANPFVGPETAIQAVGDGMLSLLFPGKVLGLRHAIGPQPRRVWDEYAQEYTSIPEWSDPVFLTTGQEGARYRFVDGMRHYYVYDSLTRRWIIQFRIADDRLSADDLDLIQWLYLRGSGFYIDSGHPYGDDAEPVAGRPYMGRWNDHAHLGNQVCWGLEAEFRPGKTRGQRLEELSDVELGRFGPGFEGRYRVTQTGSVSTLLSFAKSGAPETCPPVPEGTQASPLPGGVSIVALEMNSTGPYNSGDAIAVAVIFDRDVEVSGAPRLAIEVGGEARTAVYDAALSGPRSMVFRYTARDTDRDSDGVSVYPGSITLPSGASIRDAQRIDALLGHHGLAAQRGHTVGPVTSGQMRGAPGAVAPPALITGLEMRGSGPYGEGDAVSVAATFDWDVTVAGTPELNIEVGGSSRAALYQPLLSEAAVKVFSYTVRADDRDADGVSVYPGSIALPSGASVRDAQGKDADLTIAGLPPQPGHKVDGSVDGSQEEQPVEGEQEQPAEDEQQQQAPADSAPQTVGADSSLVPEGIGSGDSFRLLFVTSSTTAATSADIADYNAFVQAAANGNAGLKPFSGEFRALISTAAVDAKTNTETAGAGVPIHWLGGAKVADNYADLYDGSWDSVAGRTESGSGYIGTVWTGGNKTGGKSGQKYAGASEVRLGDLGDVTLALSSPTAKAASESYPLYALSPVITVAQPEPEPTPTPTPEPANSAPQFGSSSVTRSVAENAAIGANVGSPVTATDEDGDSLTYALSGSNAFAINSSSGQITVQRALDYETRSSYALTVTVSDGKNAEGNADSGVDDTIAVAVSVGNVDERGTVSFDADPPREGILLTARLRDLDGGVSGITWAWRVSADGVNWTAIAGVSGETYAPSADDAGSYLRATASYADGHGPGKSAAAATASAVEAAPTPEPAPTPTPTPAPEPQTVPADSPLVPSIIGAGDSFRLLFVTSATMKAESSDIADYNAHAQASANGNANLKSFKDGFTALISTSSVDAKSNTGTAGTGLPIHWLGGDKVADDYADLYDGSWDSVSGVTERGSSYTGLVWTGGNKAGAKSGQRYAGASEVRLGDLSDVTLPLSSPAAKASGESYPLYALSPVITVAAAAQQQQQAANNEPRFALDSDARSVDENAAIGANVGSPLTATDEDGDSLTYALSGSNAFAINSSSGQITVKGALDYETRSSYALTVTVTDGKNAEGNADGSVDDTIAVTVNVGNVDEPGRVTLSPGTPQAGSALTASLSDLDGGVSGITWAWQVSADGTNWTAIAGASGASYTPSAADVGSYLRAVASYADGHSSGKNTAADTASAVEAAPTPEPAPTPTPAPEPEPEPPAVTAGPIIISSPSDGDTYGKGEAIAVAVTFSESVTVSGDVRVRLTVGERQRWARYDHSEQDGTVLVFTYNVKKVDADPDGVSIEANQLLLRGGTVQDGDGNAANLSAPALPDQAGHKVDGF